jgi:hypothetical protein
VLIAYTGVSNHTYKTTHYLQLVRGLVGSQPAVVEEGAFFTGHHVEHFYLRTKEDNNWNA